jgi:hypothetical protein
VLRGRSFHERRSMTVVVLWVCLAALAVAAPLRLSLIAFLCLATIDFEGGTGTFALFNLLKGLVIPVWLLWRLRAFRGYRRPVLAPIAFAVLIVYAALASFWSIFPQPALKLVGHLTGSLLIAFVFTRATKGGLLTARTVLPVAVGVLALGVLCTYGFGGKWADDPHRFSSFMPAQAYAAYLAALYAISLTGPGISLAMRLGVSGLLGSAMILNGSRIWFAGMVLTTLLAVAVAKLETWVKLMAALVAAACVLLLFADLPALVAYLSKDQSGNRIASAVSAAYAGRRNATGLGTLNFRRQVNALAVQRIENSSFTTLLLGHGTSNGAVITGSLFYGYRKYVDPNRMFHNEWLRVLYEWGFIGEACWILFVGSLARFAWLGFRSDADGNARPLLVYLPAFLLGLWGENLLAGAGSAASVGFLWAIALASISHRRFERRQRQYSRQATLSAFPISEMSLP